jgi:hypothetical protein
VENEKALVGQKVVPTHTTSDNVGEKDRADFIEFKGVHSKLRTLKVPCSQEGCHVTVNHEHI